MFAVRIIPGVQAIFDQWIENYDLNGSTTKLISHGEFKLVNVDLNRYTLTQFFKIPPNFAITRAHCTHVTIHIPSVMRLRLDPVCIAIGSLEVDISECDMLQPITLNDSLPADPTVSIGDAIAEGLHIDAARIQLRVSFKQWDGVVLMNAQDFLLFSADPKQNWNESVDVSTSVALVGFKRLRFKAIRVSSVVGYFRDSKTQTEVKFWDSPIKVNITFSEVFTTINHMAQVFSQNLDNSNDVHVPAPSNIDNVGKDYTKHTHIISTDDTYGIDGWIALSTQFDIKAEDTQIEWNMEDIETLINGTKALISSITRVDADLPNKLHESSLFPLRCILSLHICDPTTWLEPSKDFSMAFLRSNKEITGLQISESVKNRLKSPQLKAHSFVVASINSQPTITMSYDQIIRLLRGAPLPCNIELLTTPQFVALRNLIINYPTYLPKPLPASLLLPQTSKLLSSPLGQVQVFFEIPKIQLRINFPSEQPDIESTSSYKTDSIDPKDGSQNLDNNLPKKSILIESRDLNMIFTPLHGLYDTQIVANNTESLFSQEANSNENGSLHPCPILLRCKQSDSRELACMTISALSIFVCESINQSRIFLLQSDHYSDLESEYSRAKTGSWKNDKSDKKRNSSTANPSSISTESKLQDDFEANVIPAMKVVIKVVCRNIVDLPLEFDLPSNRVIVDGFLRPDLIRVGRASNVNVELQRPLLTLDPQILGLLTAAMQSLKSIEKIQSFVPWNQLMEQFGAMPNSRDSLPSLLTIQKIGPWIGQLPIHIMCLGARILFKTVTNHTFTNFDERQGLRESDHKSGFSSESETFYTKSSVNGHQVSWQELWMDISTISMHIFDSPQISNVIKEHKTYNILQQWIEDRFDPIHRSLFAMDMDEVEGEATWKDKASLWLNQILHEYVETRRRLHRNCVVNVQPPKLASSNISIHIFLKDVVQEINEAHKIVHDGLQDNEDRTSEVAWRQISQMKLSKASLNYHQGTILTGSLLRSTFCVASELQGFIDARRLDSLNNIVSCIAAYLNFSDDIESSRSSQSSQSNQSKAYQHRNDLKSDTIFVIDFNGMNVEVVHGNSTKVVVEVDGVRSTDLLTSQEEACSSSQKTLLDRMFHNNLFGCLHMTNASVVYSQVSEQETPTWFITPGKSLLSSFNRYDFEVESGESVNANNRTEFRDIQENENPNLEVQRVQAQIEALQEQLKNATELLKALQDDRKRDNILQEQKSVQELSESKVDHKMKSAPLKLRITPPQLFLLLSIFPKPFPRQMNTSIQSDSLIDRNLNDDLECGSRLKHLNHSQPPKIICSMSRETQEEESFGAHQTIDVLGYFTPEFRLCNPTLCSSTQINVYVEKKANDPKLRLDISLDSTTKMVLYLLERPAETTSNPISILTMIDRLSQTSLSTGMGSEKNHGKAALCVIQFLMRKSFLDPLKCELESWLSSFVLFSPLQNDFCHKSTSNDAELAMNEIRSDCISKPLKKARNMIFELCKSDAQGNLHRKHSSLEWVLLSLTALVEVLESFLSSLPITLELFQRRWESIKSELLFRQSAQSFPKSIRVYELTREEKIDELEYYNTQPSTSNANSSQSNEKNAFQYRILRNCSQILTHKLIEFKRLQQESLSLYFDIQWVIAEIQKNSSSTANDVNGNEINEYKYEHDESMDTAILHLVQRLKTLDSLFDNASSCMGQIFVQIWMDFLFEPNVLISRLHGQNTNLQKPTRQRATSTPSSTTLRYPISPPQPNENVEKQEELTDSGTRHNSLSKIESVNQFNFPQHQIDSSLPIIVDASSVVSDLQDILSIIHVFVLLPMQKQVMLAKKTYVSNDNHTHTQFSPSFEKNSHQTPLARVSREIDCLVRNSTVHLGKVEEILVGYMWTLFHHKVFASNVESSSNLFPDSILHLWNLCLLRIRHVSQANNDVSTTSDELIQALHKDEIVSEHSPLEGVQIPHNPLNKSRKINEKSVMHKRSLSSPELHFACPASENNMDEKFSLLTNSTTSSVASLSPTPKNRSSNIMGNFTEPLHEFSFSNENTESPMWISMMTPSLVVKSQNFEGSSQTKPTEDNISREKDSIGLFLGHSQRLFSISLDFFTTHSNLPKALLLELVSSKH